MQKKNHVLTKTKESDFVGGVIDNSGLDEAINANRKPEGYSLGNIDKTIFEKHIDNVEQGTIIYFEDINDGIKNRIEHIRKLIALFFRFSLIDKNFNIILNSDPITLDDLDDLSQNTQFVWQINSIEDPYLKKILSKLDPKHINEFKCIESSLEGVKGFIASVVEPKHLKIRNTEEKVSLDLYVNGRLREQDLLKHIPSARIVENYIYGQIHLDSLDGAEKDRFTTSREGILSDDALFQSLLAYLKEVMEQITNDWDKWRVELRQDGDPENTDLITKKARKSKELVNLIFAEFVPKPESANKKTIDDWVRDLSKHADYNVEAYAECFISENILRNYIKHKSIPLSPQAKEQIQRCKDKEVQNKGAANISIVVRQSPEDVVYLGMNELAHLIDRKDPLKEPSLSRDAKEYKPIRDAIAHTALLTEDAKTRLKSIYTNIKGRIKQLLA